MVGDEMMREMYLRMSRIRQFEETAKQLLLTGQLYGSFHTSAGQEASIVGSCMALRTDDYMVGTHRSHGHPIGKGAKLDRLMAELMGKETGINHGKGGSMHLSDFGVGSLGETSIVGSGIPVAAGAALGAKMQGSDRVSLCFFGDGASNQGTFHEALNIAAVWALPAIFVCENNGYGELTSVREAVAVEDVSTRSVGYHMPGVTVDGQDVLAVYDAVATAVERARRGEGPSLVETKTYRFDNHAVGLAIEHYRDAAEIDEWKAHRDPIQLFREVLVARGMTRDELDAIDADVADEVALAVAFARDSAPPPPEQAFTDLFSTPIPTAS
jgi:pyruvate dehydrogenase E1 component alpha subunit